MQNISVKYLCRLVQPTTQNAFSFRQNSALTQKETASKICASGTFSKCWGWQALIAEIDTYAHSPLYTWEFMGEMQTLKQAINNGGFLPLAWLYISLSRVYIFFIQCIYSTGFKLYYGTQKVKFI